jgi:abortive infection alpha-like protein
MVVYSTLSVYTNFLTPSEKLKYTPPERIVSPNLAVAGPIVDAMRFVAHEPDLREMYANLLATSMDANIARNAHPAFVEIIRQLTADEAKILEVVAYEESVNISDVFKTEPGSDRPVYNLKYMNLAELSECSFSGLIPSYLDNLRRLGLTQHRNNGRHRLDFNPDGTTRYYKTEGMSFDSPIDDPKLIEVVKLLFADELEDAEGKYVRVDIMSEYVELTFLGGQFAGACILTPDQIELD